MGNGTKSEQNLQAAFAGESQANRKYLAFARQAEQEGHRQVAKLFRAAAEAETVHALNHLQALGGVKSTSDNLIEAIAGETHEFTHMYPEMIVAAKEEGASQALRSFRFAFEVEKIHAGLYLEALECLEKGHEDFDYYVCPVCGHTVERRAPETCEICGAKGSVFLRVG
jgi:rubrerythrin